MAGEEGAPYFKVQRGVPAAMVRSYKQPLYDSALMRLAAPNNELVFFQRPIGQALEDNATQKTELHTNMKQAGSLGTPLSFDLYGWNMRLPKNVSLADYRSFY